MDNTIVPVIDFSCIENLPEIDYVDKDLAIFNTLDHFPILEYPSRIKAAAFAICLNGSIRISINLEEYTITKNSLVIILPDQIVQHYEQSDDFKGVYLGISEEFIDNTIPNIQNLLSTFFYVKKHPYTLLSNEELENLVEYHAILWKRVKNKNHTYQQEVIQNLLLAWFYDICDVFRKHEPQQLNKLVSRKEELFEKFIQTVMEHYKTERSLGFYAGKLCITSKYLSLISRDISGKSAGEWIDQYVILESKTLLKSTRMSIQEIADALNFANQSFFGKYFKHHTGISPKAYRKA